MSQAKGHHERALVSRTLLGQATSVTPSGSIDRPNPTSAMSSTAINITNLSTQPVKTEGDSRMRRRRARGALNENSICPTSRNVSPNSTRSGRPLASSASSMASSNWHSCASTMSSTGTSPETQEERHLRPLLIRKTSHDTLITLADVTQNLARELSKTSMASSDQSVSTRTSTTSRTSSTLRLPYLRPRNG